MTALLQDVRHALRLVRQRPAFSTAVILCLTLGIGANTAIFSVVNSVLLCPLPYKDPDRLAMLFDTSQGPGGKLDQYTVSTQNFLTWAEQAHVFTQIEAMLPDFFNLVGEREPERLDGAEVSAGFFDLLGAKISLGRNFLPAEDRPGGPLAVILSDTLWRRRFGADPNLLGRSLVLNGKSYTVVGVLAPGFFFRRPADLWVPLALTAGHQLFPPSVHNLLVVARLRSGVTLAAAQAEMNVIANRLSREHTDTNAGWTVTVTLLREDLVGTLRPALLVLLSAVGFVLLIACANVANLLLSRATERRHEIAVRATLGAERGRLIGQVLTESLVLSLLGGMAGLLLALVAMRLLTVAEPPELADLPAATLDGRVLGFTLLISLLTGLLSGLFPALGATRAGFHQLGLKEGRRSSEGREGRRLQDLFVVAEVALALVLTVCAGLMLKSFERLNQVSLGFDSQGVLMVPISLPEWKYKSPEQIRAFWSDLLPRVEALPGVVSAGTTHVLPVNDIGLNTVFEVENRPPATPDETLIANFRKISPHLFVTLRIPLIAGRLFTDSDDADHPAVAIISRQMARGFWPEGGALGRRIRRGHTTWLTVVGIVADVQDGSLGTEPGNTLYIPLAQNPKSVNPVVYLLVRTKIVPEKVADGVRRAILSVDRDQPTGRISTLEDWISRSLAKRRFDTLLLTLFAALGLFLAAVGIYGVLSYAVRKRNHELGVRIAFGAKTGDILRTVLRQGMLLTGLGLSLGLVLALLSTRLLVGLLYQVQPTDPATFAEIIVGLLALALLVSYIPARRASRVDPIVLLKSE
jgi:putative ABC transport system permease protein